MGWWKINQDLSDQSKMKWNKNFAKSIRNCANYASEIVATVIINESNSPLHTSFPVERKGNPRDGRLKLDAARPVAKKNLTSLPAHAAGYRVQWVSEVTVDLCSRASSPSSRISNCSLLFVFHFFGLIIRAWHRHTIRTHSSTQTGLTFFSPSPSFLFLLFENLLSILWSLNFYSAWNRRDE